MTDFHTSVLGAEVLEYLQVKKGEKYIDATLGGGGHARQIIDQGGFVLGIDQDISAIEYVQQLNLTNLTTVTGSFENLADIAQQNGFFPCQGILYDLGVSSHQLDTPTRGFSFKEDAPLDMRMSPQFGVTARDLINALTEKELQELFTKYGEEREAWRIAKKIVSTRVYKPIETTFELAHLIEQTIGFSSKSHIHPATRVFQALRIAVNDELNALKSSLPQALETLASGGHLVVISFHSLEDRIVKNFFRDSAISGSLEILTAKPVEPTAAEIAQNPRSRSAKLRAAQKK